MNYINSYQRKKLSNLTLHVYSHLTDQWLVCTKDTMDIFFIQNGEPSI